MYVITLVFLEFGCIREKELKGLKQCCFGDPLLGDIKFSLYSWIDAFWFTGFLDIYFISKFSVLLLEDEHFSAFNILEDLLDPL